MDTTSLEVFKVMTGFTVGWNFETHDQAKDVPAHYMWVELDEL